MSEKISKKLTMAERFVLLRNLPQQGDLVTFKILRKLRETLSPNEQEIKEYEFKNVYRCPHREFDEKGRGFQCEVEETSETQPKCSIHNILLQPAGRVTWSEEKWNVTKEIWFGMKANQIIIDALKKVSEEDKQINDDVIASLCDKFLASEDEED